MARILAAAFSLAVALSLVSAADPVKPAGPTPVTICLATTCDMEPIYPTQAIPADARQVVAVVRLGKDDPFQKLHASWVIIESKDGKSVERELAKKDLDVPAARRCTLTLEPQGALAAGKYRLDIQADARPWKSAPFEVVPPGKPAEIKSPSDLVPLKEGTVWTYNYVQEAGGGITLNIPGVTPDADGKLRTTLTMTVGKADRDGTEVDSKLNGQLIGQEWWQPTDKGVMIVKRGNGADAVTFQPPLMLLPLPLQSRTWKWSFGGAGQQFEPISHLWGPLSIKGPQGPADRYILLTQQRDTVTVTNSAKRDVATDTLVEFIPGVGIVRQLRVNTTDGEMTIRIEMILAPK